jgi:hypothetical protein
MATNRASPPMSLRRVCMACVNTFACLVLFVAISSPVTAENVRRIYFPENLRATQVAAVRTINAFKTRLNERFGKL